MWFEDEDAVKKLVDAHPMVQPFAGSWSDQANGMHQINSMHSHSPVSLSFLLFRPVTDVVSV